MIKIFTDGACSGNPGPGGYGVVVCTKYRENGIPIEVDKMYQGMCADTTNNREELKAIIKAFQLAKTEYKEETCFIYSDSAYCVNICNNWIRGWARNNWKNSKKQTIENLDLVKQIYKFINVEFCNAEVVKIPGHCGIIENELADALATNNFTKLTKIKEENHINIPLFDF